MIRKAIFGLGLIIRDPPAMIVRDSLVMADFHIGYSIRGYDFSEVAKSKILESEVSHIVAPLKYLKGKIKRAIILGDIKECLGAPDRITRRYIEKLFREFVDIFEDIVIIRGNHDGKLHEIVCSLNINATIKDEYSINFGEEELLFLHGHIKASQKAFSRATMIMLGHIHPATSLGTKAWIAAKIAVIKREEYQEENYNVRIKKVVVFPSANPNLLGSQVSKEGLLAMLRRIAPRGNIEIQMLMCSVLDPSLRLIDML